MTKPSYEEPERVAHTHLDEAGVGKADTLGKRVLLLVNWRNALNYSLDAADKDRQSLRAELARVRGLLQRQWISVEERLPEDGQKVWIFSSNRYIGMQPCIFRSRGERWERVNGLVEPLEAGPTFRTYGLGYYDPAQINSWYPAPTFPQSSSLVPEGAESADIGNIKQRRKLRRNKSMAYTITHENMTEPFDKLSEHLQDCCGGCPYCVELCQQVVDEAQAIVAQHKVELCDKCGFPKANFVHRAGGSGDPYHTFVAGSREPEKLNNVHRPPFPRKTPHVYIEPESQAESSLSKTIDATGDNPSF